MIIEDNGMVYSVVDGVTYVTTKEIKSGECAGCAFFGTGRCDHPERPSEDCFRMKTIFKKDVLWSVKFRKKKAKYTVQDVVDAIGAIIPESFTVSKNLVRLTEAHLEKIADPEYKEFIRLMEKFGK